MGGGGKLFYAHLHVSFITYYMQRIHFQTNTIFKTLRHKHCYLSIAILVERRVQRIGLQSMKRCSRVGALFSSAASLVPRIKLTIGSKFLTCICIPLFQYCQNSRSSVRVLKETLTHSIILAIFAIKELAILV